MWLGIWSPLDKSFYIGLWSFKFNQWLFVGHGCWTVGEVPGWLLSGWSLEWHIYRGSKQLQSVLFFCLFWNNLHCFIVYLFYILWILLMKLTSHQQILPWCSAYSVICSQEMFIPLVQMLHRLPFPCHSHLTQSLHHLRLHHHSQLTPTLHHLRLCHQSLIRQSLHHPHSVSWSLHHLSQHPLELDHHLLYHFFFSLIYCAFRVKPMLHITK